MLSPEFPRTWTRAAVSSLAVDFGLMARSNGAIHQDQHLIRKSLVVCPDWGGVATASLRDDLSAADFHGGMLASTSPFGRPIALLVEEGSAPFGLESHPSVASEQVNF